MNPDQAQWQEGDEGQTATITLACSDDGQIKLESGSYKFESNDPQEVTDQFKRLVQHGLERATS